MYSLHIHQALMGFAVSYNASINQYSKLVQFLPITGKFFVFEGEASKDKKIRFMKPEIFSTLASTPTRGATNKGKL